jgi:hypothetical protein
VILDRVGTAAIEGATDERWFVAVVYRRADAAAVNAIARGSQHSTMRAISSQASPPGEAEYVGRVLTALIAKGEIGANHIAKTTARLREVSRCIAIVGARRRTDRETVDRLVAGLPADTVIVSGGAKGPDTLPRRPRASAALPSNFPARSP